MVEQSFRENANIQTLAKAIKERKLWRTIDANVLEGHGTLKKKILYY